MKKVITDKELLLEHISTNRLNDTQINYLIRNHYLEIVEQPLVNADADETPIYPERLFYVALTHKGIETAYGKIDDNQKGTGKLF